MQYQWSVHTVLLCTFQMNIVESLCWVVRCCHLTIAEVESCITLCAIQDEWAGTEAIFFFQVSSVFSAFSWIYYFSMLPYLCTLCCVAAHYHVSFFNFWSSLADDTWLFMNLPFQFLIHNHVAPEDIHEHLSKLSFLYKLQ